MRILVIADKVEKDLSPDGFSQQRCAGVDLIISCGDLPPEYLGFLRNTLAVPLVYVMGNHDLRYGQASLAGCLNIHRRLVTIGGKRILGLAGSRWYNGGMNQYREKEMRWFVWSLWGALLKNRGVDIVVTHAPPRGLGDAEDRCHKGFTCFNKLIQKYQPQYFIHGHIHAPFATDEERKIMVNQTTVMNGYGYFFLDY